MGVVSAETYTHVPRGGILFNNATELAAKLHHNDLLYEEFIRSGNGSSQRIDDNNDLLQGMPSCWQYCSEWCWATVSAMVIDHYKGAKTSCDTRECEIAGREFGQNCCPDSHACQHSPNAPAGGCNRPGQESQIIDAIHHYAGEECHSHGPLSQSSLDKALQSAPVVVLVSWPNGGGHAIVVGSHPKKKGQYNVHNPWHWSPNEHLSSWTTHSYGGLLRYKMGNVIGKWAASIDCPASHRRRSNGERKRWRSYGAGSFDGKADNMTEVVV